MVQNLTWTISFIQMLYSILCYIRVESNMLEIMEIFEMFTAGTASMSTAFTLSTIATSSIEEIAAGAPDVLRFFQLYIYRERDVTRQLVRRAEACGFKALILTVDTPFFGKRLADNRNKFKLPPHLK